MNKSEICLTQCILYVLDRSCRLPSGTDISHEVDAAIDTYIKKIIIKIIDSISLRKGNLNFTDLPLDFKEWSQEIYSKISLLTTNNKDILEGDLLFVRCKMSEKEYIFFIKLNYISSMIHSIEKTGEIKLVEYFRNLPQPQKKIDEFFFIDLGNEQVYCSDYKCYIEGNREFYIEKYLLDINCNNSENEMIKTINQITARTINKHYTDSKQKVLEYKQCLAESVENTAKINIQDISSELFEDEEIKSEYLEALKDKGIYEEDIIVSEKLEKKVRKKQKISTPTGIEIKIPLDYLNHKDFFEYQQLENGKINLLIKNLDSIKYE